MVPLKCVSVYWDIGACLWCHYPSAAAPWNALPADQVELVADTKAVEFHVIASEPAPGPAAGGAVVETSPHHSRCFNQTMSSLLGCFTKLVSEYIFHSREQHMKVILLSNTAAVVQSEHDQL